MYRAAGESASLCLMLPYRCVRVISHLGINIYLSIFYHQLCSCNILSLCFSFLWLIVVRRCHLDMKAVRSCIPPAVLSAGWPVGRMELSTGMDSQQSVYLYLIIWQLQGRESWGSMIPSWCLILHSFSYWIFLFKAALLMLTTASAPMQ